MSEVKHTPGEWIFDMSDLGVYNDIGTGICTIKRHAKIVGQDNLNMSGLSIQTMANASIIIAAPDLLEALEEMVYEFNDNFCEGSTSWAALQNAKSAIKRAKGL
jgi:hypothetical protein